MPASHEISSRPFEGRADLRAMEAPMSAAWAGPRRPFVPGTPGDLECIPTINYDRAWAAALTLILIVMLLNLIGRLITRFFAPKNLG